MGFTSALDGGSAADARQRGYVLLQPAAVRPRVFALDDAPALAAAAAWLRPCALVGQAAAVAVAAGPLGVALPLPQLVGGLLVLAAVVPLALWRLHWKLPIHEVEACGHIAFDLLLLGWMLYWTGGDSNPFTTLLLVPIALCAASLSVRAIAAVTALAIAVYGGLFVHSVPLPAVTMGTRGFDLHLTGMAVNFVIAAVLLTVFIARMRLALKARSDTARDLRERAVRDEGILAIATQAADAAHRLNTPLSTVCTLVEELRCADRSDGERQADLGLMATQLERCRGVLRDMVDYGRGQLDGTTQSVRLADYVEARADHLRLLYPGVAVATRVPEPCRGRTIRVQPSLAHALLSLMQNAWQASRRNGSAVVTLSATAYGERVEFVVGDEGSGFAEERAGDLFASGGASHGLGIGLALARATIERMHGRMEAHSSMSGSEVRVELPMEPAGP